MPTLAVSLAVSLVIALAPASRPPGSRAPERRAYLAHARLERPGSDAGCAEGQGCAGDEEDGRAPPGRDGRDDGEDRAGLHEPDWLRDGDRDDDEEDAEVQLR